MAAILVAHFGFARTQAIDPCQIPRPSKNAGCAGCARLDWRQFRFPFASMQIQLGDVGHIIQLAIAPVFLLTGVGTNLLVLTNRLARIIDRSRALENRMDTLGEAVRAESLDEIAVLFRRAKLINTAITLSTTCGLLICLVVASLFLGDAFDLDLATFIGAMFVLAMFSLIGSFVFLLREIFVAIQALSMGARHRRQT
jgi:hypothetical protein